MYHLGSSNVVIDDTGSWVNHEEYTPYGETSFGSFARKRYRYTGKERDEESGLYYHGARYYVPWLGRWTSCDPAGMVSGLNLYEFVNNTTLRFIDPKGLNPEQADNQNQLRVNNTEGNKAAQELGDLVTSKGNEVAHTEAVSKSGNGGARHDLLIKKPGVVGSERSLESKLIDLGKKTYCTAEGLLRESALARRVRRELAQHEKHIQALKDAVGTFSRTTRSGASAALNEIMIFTVKNASPAELRQFQKIISRIVEAAEGVKPGIAAIGNKSGGGVKAVGPGLAWTAAEGIIERNVAEAAAMRARTSGTTEAPVAEEIRANGLQGYRYERVDGKTEWKYDPPFEIRMREVIRYLFKSTDYSWHMEQHQRAMQDPWRDFA